MQLYYTRGGQTGNVQSTATRVTKARLIHNQGQCIGRCKRQTDRISKRQAGSKGQAANGQKSINSPGSQQETYTGKTLRDIGSSETILGYEREEVQSL